MRLIQKLITKNRLHEIIQKAKGIQRGKMRLRQFNGKNDASSELRELRASSGERVAASSRAKTSLVASHSERKIDGINLQ